MRVLTGIQPSGKLHLGNYFSAIKKVLEYQSKSELYLFLANFHSLTTFKSKEQQLDQTLACAMDLLALGIDPEQTVFWVQSDVPEVTELSWYLSMAITVSQLNLAHSFKDKTGRGIVPSAGLYTYPVLMAADILAFQADRVPVGKDQKQHLEFARDIAEKFNRDFGPVFSIPEADIAEDTALVPGTDGAKMSKSYNNTINFFDTEKQIQKSVMGIVSDSLGIQDPKDPDNSAIFAIHSLFLNADEKQELAQRYRTPGTGYGDLKKALLKSVLDHFAPYREKRSELEKSPDRVRDILKSGAQKAKERIQPTMEKVRSVLGIPL